MHLEYFVLLESIIPLFSFLYTYDQFIFQTSSMIEKGRQSTCINLREKVELLCYRYGRDSVVVFYCCVTNYHKPSWLKEICFYLLISSWVRSLGAT